MRRFIIGATVLLLIVSSAHAYLPPKISETLSEDEVYSLWKNSPHTRIDNVARISELRKESFVVKGQVTDVSTCPSCPPGQACGGCPTQYIYIATENYMRSMVGRPRGQVKLFLSRQRDYRIGDSFIFLIRQTPGEGAARGLTMDDILGKDLGLKVAWELVDARRDYEK